MKVKFEWISRSASETKQLAEKLGNYCKAGHVLLLVADLGSGKTTFVQGLLRGCGGKDQALSPTFVLAQTIPGRVPLHHLDFYRCEENDLNSIGLQDYFYGLGEIPPGVVVIEWADRFKEIWPKDHLLIKISILKNQARRFLFHPMGNGYRQLIEKIAKSCQLKKLP